MNTNNNIEKLVFSANNLHKAFGGQVVLNDVSLELRCGEVVLLRGENGSGKTTLLNILTGNLVPDKGEINININGSRERFLFPKQWWKELNPFDHFTPERLAWEGVGRVWQDIRLFPTMTTLENVAVSSPSQKGENPAFALISYGAIKEESVNKEKSSGWLKGLGLGDKLDSSCDKISLGQMKRVAIARAIQAGAKVLFLDEPLSGLDQKGTSEIMEYLKTLVNKHSITIVIVEHVFNIPIILNLADTVWTLLDGTISVNKTNELIKEKRIHDDSHNLMQLILGNNENIYTENLPDGAIIKSASFGDSKNEQIAFEVKDLVVKRGERIIINGLSFNLKKGQIAILEAPNGWGKSTLLDAIFGIEKLESGKIILNGKEITLIPTYKKIKMGLSYLRSLQSTFPSLSVEEHKRLSKKNNLLFNDALNGNSKGSFLSGGEKQKLQIDILPDADVYFLDEPMIGLDAGSIMKISKNIRDLVKKGKSVLIAVPNHERFLN